MDLAACGVAWCTNDAACQVLTARAMLVLADCGPGPVRDRPAAHPHWHGRSDPDEPIAVIVFFLGAMVMRNC